MIFCRRRWPRKRRRCWQSRGRFVPRTEFLSSEFERISVLNGTNGNKGEKGRSREPFTTPHATETEKPHFYSLISYFFFSIYTQTQYIYPRKAEKNEKTRTKAYVHNNLCKITVTNCFLYYL